MARWLARRHTHVDDVVLWAGYLPDQFGHIGQMPQILHLFGVSVI